MTSAADLSKAQTEEDDWDKAEVEMTKKLSQLTVNINHRSISAPFLSDTTWTPPPQTIEMPSQYGFYPQSSSPLSRVTTTAIASNSSPLDPVLVAALENSRERLTLLKFEDQIIQFLKSPREVELVFPPLSSYHRLIIHRLAERCALEHQTSDFNPYNSTGYDSNAARVVTLFKSPRCCIPSVLLIDLSAELSQPPPQPHMQNAPPKIMTRKQNKGALSKNPKTQSTDTRNRTIQDREKAYAEARARIFGDQIEEVDTNNTPKPISPAKTNHVNQEAAEAARRILSTSNSTGSHSEPKPKQSIHQHDWKESKAQYRDRQKEMNDPDFARHTPSYRTPSTYGNGQSYSRYNEYRPPQQYQEYQRTDYQPTNTEYFQRGPPPMPQQMYTRRAPTPPPVVYSEKDFPPLGG